MTAVPYCIAVAVDGSVRDRPAVSWAAAAAAQRHLPLRLLHARGHWFERSEAALVQAAQESAPPTAEGLQIEVHAEAGNPVEILSNYSTDASMLVVAPHTGEPLESFGWSTAAALSATTSCPLVAVPPRRHHDGHGAVVVGVDGVDGTPVSEAAIAFAFDHAAVTGANLIAVHARNDATVPAVDDQAAAVRHDRAEHDQQRVLAEALAGWQEKYPDVTVELIVAQGAARDALLDCAATAQLLVVGSSGQAGLPGLLHGSTSQALLYQLRCPLAVVRDPV